MQAIQITAPPSKSISHRAVIAAGLANGVSLLHGVLDSQDLSRTIAAMRALGADIQKDAYGQVRVSGMAGRIRGGSPDQPVDIDVGESGTTCRLITAVAAAGQGCFLIHGQGRMHERPIRPLSQALLSQGIRIVWPGQEGFPPLLLDSQGLPGGRVSINLSDSSQYLSGLLLAAPLARQDLLLELAGRPVSWPYVGLTLQVMRDFGVNCQPETFDGSTWWPAERLAVLDPAATRFRVRPAAYRATDYQVEGDWSNASYFLAAGLLGATPVAVAGLRPDSGQGDRAILDIFERMGGCFAWNADTVTASPGPLQGINVNMAHCPDLVPTVAVVAAQSQGETIITGVSHLRLKESDRLAAVAGELTKAGAMVEVLEDGLRIRGGLPEPVGRLDLSCHGDHRLAMSMSLLVFAGIRPILDDPACVAKSFPDFWQRWDRIIS